MGDLAAAQIGPETQYGLLGAVLLILSTSTWLIVRLIRISNAAVDGFVKPAERRLKALERENRLCGKRLAMLIEILQRRGIPIPNTIWTIPEMEEPWVEEEDAGA